MHSPTDASPPSLRTATHGLGPIWIATPSSYRTCTDCSLPVPRRTAKDSGHYQDFFTRCWDKVDEYPTLQTYRPISIFAERKACNCYKLDILAQQRVADSLAR